MATIASLIVRIGAQDQEIQHALTSVGQKAKSVDADLKKLGNTPLAGQAQKSLESLKATMTQITDAQQRVAERARLAAQGLEAMGGASRFTDSQLKQINRTLQEGISAYRALGKEAPEELQKVADAVKGKVEQPLGTLKASVIAIGTAIGTVLANVAQVAARELIRAGKAAFEYGDALTNLSTTTGITVEGLQRLESIGVSGGVSMETLANAVNQLQLRLNDPAAINALRQMGLNYQLIRSLEPEQQFLEIAKAVAAIEDPVIRANTGAALFGRTWTTIAPAIQGDIQKIIDATTILNKEQVQGLSEAQNAWERWKFNASKSIAEFMGNVVLASKRWDEVSQRRNSLFNPGLPNVPAAPAPSGQPNATRNAQGFIPLGVPVPSFTLEGLQELVRSGQALEEQYEKQRAAAARFKTVQDQLFGRAIIANAEELVRALGSTENLTKLTAASTKKLHDELGQAIAAYRALGREVPPTLQEIYEKTTQIRTIAAIQPQFQGLQGLTKTFVAFGEAAQDGTLYARDFTYELNAAQIQTDYFGNAIKTTLIPPLKRVAIDLGEAEEKATSFTQAFKSLFSGKGFGDLGKAFKGSLDDIKEGIFEGFGNLLSQGIVSLINKGISLLVGGVKKLFGNLFGTAGRDAVREFASLHGGFDELHKRLGLLGDEGERLWIALTQGVGRNNAEQAKAAIERVTAALEAQKRKFEELQGAVGTVSDKMTGITLITPEIQAALDDVFDETTTEGYLSAVQRLNSELDKQAQKYQDIEAALNKYNISIDETGQQFKQLKLNELAVQLRKDFDNLRASGVDINVQMRAMGSNIRDFIAQARKSGLEIPESMREIIQVAIDAGEVFDDNGNKITDMSQLGLKFGTTMQEAMQTVESAISRLNTILEGLAKFLGIELPKAAERAADGINDALGDIEDPEVTVRVNLPKDIPRGGYGDYYEGPEDLPSYGVPEFHKGSRGIRDFGAGTLAVLHGREAVVTEADLRSGQEAAMLGHASSPSVSVTITGPVLAAREYVERELVEPLLDGIRRYGMAKFTRLVESVP